MHRHYTFKMDECLIFQKITSQEQLIIYALDHLEQEQEKEEEDLEDNDDDDYEDEDEDDEYEYEIKT